MLGVSRLVGSWSRYDPNRLFPGIGWTPGDLGDRLELLWLVGGTVLVAAVSVLAAPA
jgi:hypothetical protein